MRKWPAEKLLHLLLAVFIAVGLNLTPLQASGMPMKMEMAAGMSGAMDDECDDCVQDSAKSAGSGMTAVVCGVFCAVPVLAVIPNAPPAGTAQLKLALVPAYATMLHGLRAPPDPHPPRRADIA